MAEAIGEVTILHGTAVADGPDGVRELAVGDPIFEDDVLSTGSKSALEVEFTDGALLSQGPSSKVRLDEYAFDPDKDAGEITMDFMEGTFRSVTGKIVDMNPEGFQIKTPNTTIGIRGTTTGHVIDPDGAEEHVVIDFVDKPVVFIPEDGGPIRVITRDGMGVSASAEGLSKVRPAPESVISRLEQLSTESLEKSAPIFNGDDNGQDENAEAETGQEEQVAQEADVEQMIEAGLIDETLLAEQHPDMETPEARITSQLSFMPDLAPARQNEILLDDGSVQEPTTLDFSEYEGELTVKLANSPAGYYRPTSGEGESGSFGHSVLNLIGSSEYANHMTGNYHNNILIGGMGEDTILGGAGDDLIVGLGSGDSLDGGDGDNDFISYAADHLHGSGVMGGVVVNLGDGTALDSWGNEDTISGFESVLGSVRDDHLIGTAEGNTLYGDSGNDTLDGQGGDDILAGGPDNDTFLFGDGRATYHTVIDGGEGIDTIRVEGNADLYRAKTITSVEQLEFASPGNTVTFHASGFPFGNGGTITGSSEDGSDTVVIKAEAVTTGETYDLTTITLESWEADDKFYFRGSQHDDIYRGTEGSDLVKGNDGNDTLYGGDGSDTIHGMGGSNLLFGGDNADGADMASFIGSEMVTNGNLQTGIIQHVEGTDTISGFEQFVGSTKGNVLTLSDDYDIIYGSHADDTFIVSGEDFLDSELQGMSHKDGDVLRFAGSTSLSVSGSTFCSIEKLELKADSPATLTVDADFLHANSMAITIDAGNTLDIDGLNVDDSLYLQYLTEFSLEDTAAVDIEMFGGDDKVGMGANMSSMITVDGGDGYDKLYYTDAGFTDELDNVTGFEQIVIYGDSEVVVSNNNLTSHGDIFINARYIEDGSSLHFDASADTNGNQYEFCASKGNDVIIAGRGDDVIYGNDGDDFISGNLGSDLLWGQAGSDTFHYSSTSEGGDLIKYFESGVDKVHFDKTEFDASATFKEITDLDYRADGVSGLDASGPQFVFLEMGSRGELYYDKDGNGGGDHELIAEFYLDSGLNGGDIEVV